MPLISVWHLKKHTKLVDVWLALTVDKQYFCEHWEHPFIWATYLHNLGICIK